jgi:hypothetical protein
MKVAHSCLGWTKEISTSHSYSMKNGSKMLVPSTLWMLSNTFGLINGQD